MPVCPVRPHKFAYHVQDLSDDAMVVLKEGHRDPHDRN